MAIAIKTLDVPLLNQLARTLADSMTHRDLNSLLQQCCIEADGGDPKWERMQNAWVKQQSRDGCGNAIIRFVQLALQPVRFLEREADFERYRGNANRILSFAGLEIAEDGTPKLAQTTRTISEAKTRANTLHAKLEQRMVHPDVMRFCRAELLSENYFHAVLEAAKSVAEKLRVESGLSTDGSELVDATLCGNQPLLAINTLQTETERSEQRGFALLVKGVFGTFRNVTAHAPKVRWAVNEADALDLFSTLSYVHRRLDSAVKI